MKITTFAQTLHDLNLIKDQDLDEVILGHKDFSRFGKLKTQDLIQLSQRARELGLKVIFEWDILMTEGVFENVIAALPSLLEHVDILRVQDPGALEWSLANTQKTLQFIAENGNHNIVALQGWIDHAQGRLERIILSIELPKDIIEEYARNLTVPCELLGLGRILLFYTPRQLLSPLYDDQKLYHQELIAIGESEESPHKGFPIVENQHGTFMFHIKDFCLIEYAQELSQRGLHYFRIDLRWSEMTLLKDVLEIFKNANPEKFEAFKLNYKQELMKGYFHVNKTDVLFPKLKNHRLQNREGNYLGEVIEAEKGSHLAIQIKNPLGLKASDSLKIVHPKGEEFSVKIYSLKNLALEEVEFVGPHQTAIIQFVGGVWVKSHVFLEKELATNL